MIIAFLLFAFFPSPSCGLAAGVVESVSSVASRELTYAWRGNQSLRLSGRAQRCHSAVSHTHHYLSYPQLGGERESVQDTELRDD